MKQITAFLFVSIFALGTLFFNVGIVFADDLALAGSNSVTGSIGIAMPITDLQVTGTTPGTTPVKLRVTNGTLALSQTTGLTFTGGQTGSTLYFSGTLANINAALATLTYTRGGTGTDTLEVSLVNPGEVFFPDNGHLYKFISGSTSWNSAFGAAPNQTAYGANGYLATITSQAENNFIAARLTGDGWIGGSDSAVEGEWRWVSGPEAGTLFWNGTFAGSAVPGQFSNWSNNEPNQAGDEDCIQVYISGGQWNDLGCGNVLSGYVAEFGAPGNMPTVVSKDISITTVALPVVNTLTPSDNATNVSTSNNFSIVFSQVVTKDSGNITIKKTSDDSTVETIPVSSDQVTGSGTNTITINPTANLAELTGFYVLIDGTAFKNSSNGYYAGISVKTTWNFTTGDFTPPTVPGVPSTITPTNDTTPTFTWTGSTDGASGLAIYLLKWSQNPDCSLGANTTTGGTSYTLPALAEGVWYFCVAARDNANNDSLYTAAGTVTVDITAPVLTQTQQIAQYIANTSAVYYFSTTEAGTINSSQCGAGSQVQFSSTVGLTGLTALLSGLQPGTTYSCTFTVTDTAGNMSNSLTIGPFTVNMGAVSPVILQAMSDALRAQTIQSSRTDSQSTNTYTNQSPQLFLINMKQGDRNNDVRRLQEFLKNESPDIYPEGQITGYFGPLTYKAVVRFQEKYGNDILIPNGTPKKGTGFVGEYTRKKLNAIILQ